jgi:hypothetical protein
MPVASGYRTLCARELSINVKEAEAEMRFWVELILLQPRA